MNNIFNCWYFYVFLGVSAVYKTKQNIMYLKMIIIKLYCGQSLLLTMKLEVDQFRFQSEFPAAHSAWRIHNKDVTAQELTI